MRPKILRRVIPLFAFLLLGCPDSFETRSTRSVCEHLIPADVDVKAGYYRYKGDGDKAFHLTRVGKGRYKVKWSADIESGEYEVRTCKAGPQIIAEAIHDGQQSQIGFQVKGRNILLSNSDESGLKKRLSSAGLTYSEKQVGDSTRIVVENNDVAASKKLAGVLSKADHFDVYVLDTAPGTAEPKSKQVSSAGEPEKSCHDLLSKDGAEVWTPAYYAGIPGTPNFIGVSAFDSSTGTDMVGISILPPKGGDTDSLPCFKSNASGYFSFKNFGRMTVRNESRVSCGQAYVFKMPDQLSRYPLTAISLDSDEGALKVELSREDRTEFRRAVSCLMDR